MRQAAANANKKILLVAFEISDTGGIERYTGSILEALSRHSPSLEIEVLIVRKNELAVQAIRKRYPDVRIWYVGGRARLLLFLRYGIMFFWRILLLRPDAVLVNHVFLVHRFPVWVLRLLPPYTIMTYGIEAWEADRHKRRAFSCARLITSISSFTTSAIRAWFGESVDILHLPPTTDFDRFTIASPRIDIRTQLEIPDSNPLILCLCRFSAEEKYKGYDRLIRAWPAVKVIHPDANMVLAGHGDDRERAEEMARQLNVSTSVHFPGRIPEDILPDYYRSCDVFVMPSTGEGFGIVFLEALACGRIVIAGNRDGSVDPLQQGAVGLLVDPCNQNEIEQAIIKCLSGNVPKHLTNAGWIRNKTLEVFGPQAHHKRTEALVDLMLADERDEGL